MDDDVICQVVALRGLQVINGVFLTLITNNCFDRRFFQQFGLCIEDVDDIARMELIDLLPTLGLGKNRMVSRNQEIMISASLDLVENIFRTVVSEDFS